MSPVPQAVAAQAVAAQAIVLPAEVPPAGPAQFLVGQDPEGFWVAVEIHGRAGGLFRSRRDAEHFAAEETGRRPEAVTVSGERIALRL